MLIWRIDGMVAVKDSKLGLIDALVDKQQTSRRDKSCRVSQCSKAGLPCW